MINIIRKRMMIWDSPIYLTHWLLAFCFLGAIITQDSERFRLVHVTMGYTMLGIVVFRFMWGIIGSKYARFTTLKPRFQRAPNNIQSIFNGKKEFSIALNALAFSAAYLLMLVVLLVAASGYLVFNEIGPEVLEDVHEFLGNLLIAVVVAHIASVMLSTANQYLDSSKPSTVKKIDLVIEKARPYRWVSLIIALAVIYFWGIQFKAW